MGWLVDPDEQTVFVYRPKQQTEVFDQILPVPALAAEFQITVSNLFSWLLD